MRSIEKQRDSLTGFQVDEFFYSKSQDLGGGKHRQEVIYKGKTVGYLLYIEKNPFFYEEKYVIPDIEKGFTFDSKISSPTVLAGLTLRYLTTMYSHKSIYECTLKRLAYYGSTEIGTRLRFAIHSAYNN